MNSAISIEKKKSDKLLLNILPEKTAEELKKYGHTKPQHYNEVSVMFIDFVKFTHIAEKLTPEELAEKMNREQHYIVSKIRDYKSLTGNNTSSITNLPILT